MRTQRVETLAVFVDVDLATGAELTLDRYGHLDPDQMVVLTQRLEDARNGALLDDPKA